MDASRKIKHKKFLGVGRIDSGQPDLGSNPEHLAGFGKSKPSVYATTASAPATNIRRSRRHRPSKSELRNR